MAKVGNLRLNIPDEFFVRAAQEKLPELEVTANRVAGNVRSAAAAHLGESPEVKVIMTENENGRPTAILYLAHPAGVGLQAKYGVMTMGAAREGLDVHRSKFSA